MFDSRARALAPSRAERKRACSWRSRARAHARATSYSTRYVISNDSSAAHVRQYKILWSVRQRTCHTNVRQLMRVVPWLRLHIELNDCECCPEDRPCGAQHVPMHSNMSRLLDHQHCTGITVPSVAPDGHMSDESGTSSIDVVPESVTIPMSGRVWPKCRYLTDSVDVGSRCPISLQKRSTPSQVGRCWPASHQTYGRIGPMWSPQIPSM